MARILASNGHPIGHQPALARPNEIAVNVGIQLGPAGPVMVVQYTGPGGAQEVRPVPMTPDVSRQVGLHLISAAAVWEHMQQRARDEADPFDLGPKETTNKLHEDLLDEARRNVGDGEAR